MNFIEGILLGLSTGTVCIAYCGPILIPYLLAERNSLKKSIILVLYFLSGRFIAYVITGLIVGIIGLFIFKNPIFNQLFVGISYIILSGLLIFYAFYRFKSVCLGHNTLNTNKKRAFRWQILVPVFGGLVSGINLCPHICTRYNSGKYAK